MAWRSGFAWRRSHVDRSFCGWQHIAQVCRTASISTNAVLHNLRYFFATGSAKRLHVPCCW